MFHPARGVEIAVEISDRGKSGMGDVCVVKKKWDPSKDQWDFQGTPIMGRLGPHTIPNTTPIRIPKHQATIFFWNPVGFPRFTIILVAQMLHGTGIFTYIYHKFTVSQM